MARIIWSWVVLASESDPPNSVNNGISEQGRIPPKNNGSSEEVLRNFEEFLKYKYYNINRDICINTSSQSNYVFI